MVIQRAALLTLVVWSMWSPGDTHPESLFVTAVLLSLLVVARGVESAHGFVLIGPGSVLLIAGLAAAVSSPDRISAAGRLVLLAAVSAAILAGSRIRQRGLDRAVFVAAALVLAGWGLVQALGGLGGLRPAVEALPEGLRAGALARIESGRAFASLLFPGHLAALLATALPLAMGLDGSRRISVLRMLAVVGIGAGVVATRSPIGIVLCLVAGGIVMVRRSRTLVFAMVVAGGGLAVGMALLRPDLARLEPFLHRFDNWSAALWLWWQNPVSGVGLGGFGLAVQSVPMDLANRPAHAHNLPLEWLAELGPLGFLAALLILIWVGRLAWRLGFTDPHLSAAIVIVPLHNLLDFSWFSWGVAIPWAVLMGWGLAEVKGSGPAGEAAPGPRRGVAWAVVTGTIAVVAAATNWWASTLAVRSLDQPVDLARAQVHRAIAWAPWRADLVDRAADLSVRGPVGDPERALEALRRSAWQRPGSATRRQLDAGLAASALRPLDALGELWWVGRMQTHESERRREYDRILDHLNRSTEKGGDTP